MSAEAEWGDASRIAAAERITVAAAELARAALASGLVALLGPIEAVILEAWREASEPRRLSLNGAVSANGSEPGAQRMETR